MVNEIILYYDARSKKHQILYQLLREDDEENLQPDGTPVSRYIPVSCTVVAMSSTAVMDNSHDKTKTGETEHPFVTAQEGRRTFTVVTYYSDAHACDQKLCTDVVAVESYKREDTNKSN